ncbi:RNA polymerase sigma-70 factor [Pedobacter panaciterrae]|uniref:RNA polymerase sigma-70 factor n=1 Tax=Pedobacter panaciterrae TaxID=363849 RepID=A0ABU8NSG7_9SPHI
MEDEDQILLEQLKGGDYTAYELIFKKYYKVLSTKAYFMLEDDMEAEDLVQNLFIAIWQKKLFLSINTSIKAYLLRSVHNRCLTVLRDKKVSERKLNAYTEEQSWQGEEDQETNQENDYQGKFDLIFEQLPTQRQKAFKLVYLEDKKYKEAAEEMGLSVNSIKTHLKLAVKALQKKLINFK